MIIISFNKNIYRDEGFLITKYFTMRSSKQIYLLILLVFLLIVIGLAYRLTKENGVNTEAPKSHTGYPF